MQEPTAIELFVPGRICLFGEHSDWAGGYRRINSAIEKGYAIIAGTNQGLYARVTKTPGRFVFRSTDPTGTQTVLDEPMESNSLLAIAESGGFFSYAAGVAYQALVHHHVDGISVDNYRTDLPQRKGLSSSAATCVLTARAFNRIYDLKLTTRGEMDLAYRGEITTPSRCGRMDQGCAYGNRPILMTFDGDAITVDELHVEKSLYLVIADLKGAKDTVRILADLNRAYPFADDDLQRSVQHFLGPENTSIVAEARQAIEAGDSAEVGRVMQRAQAAFDSALRPASPKELASPKLHQALADDGVQERSYGGKGVGSQGDGTAQFVVSDAQAQTRLASYLESRFGFECLPLTVNRSRPIRKAVITAAGHGTRLFPMTKIIRKEFMPVRDSRRNLVPLILAHILDAIDAGIEEIALIIQPHDEPRFRKLLHEPVPAEVFGKLTSANQERAREIEAAGARVSFIHQTEQRGLGHAVLETRHWVGGDTFLLVLGDHYFISEDEDVESASCYEQLLGSYRKTHGSLIGVVTTAAREIHRFGTVAGQWETDGELLGITHLAEKPSVDYASNHMTVEGLEADQYFTLFGLYILSPEIYAILERMESGHEYERSELQLTGALEHLRTSHSLHGMPIRGRKLDIGRPEEYVAAFQANVPER